jgi:hypothetical protein
MDLGRPLGAFRSAVLPLAGATIKFAATGGLVVAIINLIFGQPALAAGWTTAKWLGIAAAVLFSGAWIYSRVHVFERGLRSYDFSGRYHDVPWASIRGTREASMAGLRYIVASSVAPKVELWVPVFIANKPDFCAALQSHAGPSHPLTRAVLGV